MEIRVRLRLKPDRENYQMYYVDHVTGEDVTKSARTSDVRQAERAASKWESELEECGPVKRAMSWDEFRVYYEDNHLVAKSAKTRSLTATAMNSMERSVGKPKRLDLIDSQLIARLVADWRKLKIGETTIAAYLRHLRAAMGWAHKMQLIRQRPQFVMPSKTSTRFMRGRPITVKEFRQLLRACRVARPKDWRQWVRFYRGLWLSGLRLDEAVKLSWTDPPLRVDLDGGKYPRLVIHAAGQKSRRDEVAPIAPDFAKWLSRTPAEKRVGLVLPLFSTLGKNRTLRNSSKIGNYLSDIGEASKVVVNDKGKFASAHDMRRSFGTRWAAKVKPLALKRLMRHTSIETTLRYYVDQDADDVAEELWGSELYGARP